MSLTKYWLSNQKSTKYLSTLENYFLLPNLQKSTKRYIQLLGSFSVALMMGDQHTFVDLVGFRANCSLLQILLSETEHFHHSWPLQEVCTGASQKIRKSTFLTVNVIAEIKRSNLDSDFISMGKTCILGGNKKTFLCSKRWCSVYQIVNTL